MCAGVQKVSRPMERCQEISQCVPTIAEVTAMTEHQTYQGIAAADAALVLSAERTDTDAREWYAAGHISLRFLKLYVTGPG